MSDQNHQNDNGHDQGHHHHVSHDHGPLRPDIEDTPPTHYQLMTQAVGDLLIRKGVITADEMRATIEVIDSKSPMMGAKVIARAWIDAEFKERLLENTNKAANELGIDTGAIHIKTVENTPDVHNVVVCTLCSCYPRLLIGLPPDWYKSRAYRSRTVREPRAVLAEFGTHISNDVEVRVHDSTADLRYLVLPKRPPGTDGWTEEKLAALVTRDTMIGVAEIADPEGA